MANKFHVKTIIPFHKMERDDARTLKTH